MYYINFSYNCWEDQTIFANLSIINDHYSMRVKAYLHENVYNVKPDRGGREDTGYEEDESFVERTMP